MPRLYIIFILLVGIDPIYGQGNTCIPNDTNLCYIKEKYSSSNIAIEKKLESEGEILTTDNSLLADMDGDCIPEFIIPDFNYQKFSLSIQKQDLPNGKLVRHFSVLSLQEVLLLQIWIMMADRKYFSRLQQLIFLGISWEN